MLPGKRICPCFWGYSIENVFEDKWSEFHTEVHLKSPEEWNRGWWLCCRWGVSYRCVGQRCDWQCDWEFWVWASLTGVPQSHADAWPEPGFAQHARISTLTAGTRLHALFQPWTEALPQMSSTSRGRRVLSIIVVVLLAGTAADNGYIVAVAPQLQRGIQLSGYLTKNN